MFQYLKSQQAKLFIIKLQLAALFISFMTLVTEPLLALDVSSQGGISSFYSQYPIDKSELYARQTGGFRLIENLNLVFGKSLSAVVDGAAVYDAFGKTQQDKTQLIGKNLYLQYQHKDLQIKFGSQILTHTMTDLINPFDVVHGKDFKDPTTPESFGSEGVSINLDSGEFIWTTFLIPLQQVNRLPSEKSPWWPREKRLPVENEFIGEAVIPKDVEYRISGGEEINSARKNNWMIRGIWIKPRFELALQFYEGLSQNPNVFFNATSTNFVLDSPIELKPFYFKQQVTSLGLTLPFDFVTVKVAGKRMQAIGSDSRLPEPESQTVVAIEKNQEFKFGLVTWILENTREFKKNQNQISFLRSVFENAWILGARVPIFDNHQVLLGVVYDSVGKSNISKMNYRYRISDRVSAEIDAQTLSGPSETLVGLYDKYDSAGLKINYIW